MQKPSMTNKQFERRIDTYQEREQLPTRSAAVAKLSTVIYRTERTIWRYLSGEQPIDGLVVDAIKSATTTPDSK